MLKLCLKLNAATRKDQNNVMNPLQTTIWIIALILVFAHGLTIHMTLISDKAINDPDGAFKFARYIVPTFIVSAGAISLFFVMVRFSGALLIVLLVQGALVLAYAKLRKPQERLPRNESPRRYALSERSRTIISVMLFTGYAYLGFSFGALG